MSGELKDDVLMDGHRWFRDDGPLVSQLQAENAKLQEARELLKESLECLQDFYDAEETDIAPWGVLLPIISKVQGFLGPTSPEAP